MVLESEAEVITLAARRELNDHLSYALCDLAWRLHRELALAFRIEGAPVEYWRVLRALSEHPGESLTRLSERALLNLPTLSKLVDRMAADALVYRRPDPADGRRVMLYLSDRGAALLERLDGLVGSQELRLEQALGREGSSELAARLATLRTALESSSAATQAAAPPSASRA